MKKGINLALRRKRVETLFRKAFLVSVVLFISTVVVSLSLIAYRLILKSSYDALDKKEENINEQLLTLVGKRDKFIETKSRISEVTKLLSARAPVATRIDTVSTVIPADSSVNNFSGDDKQLKIDLESENLSSLNDLVEQRVQELASDKKRQIGKVELNSFGLNPKTLKYTVSLTVTFN